MATAKRARTAKTAKNAKVKKATRAKSQERAGTPDVALKSVAKTAAKAMPQMAAMQMAGRPDSARRPPSAMIYSLGDSWFKYPTIFDQGAPINLIRALESANQPHGDRYFLVERGVAGATSDELTSGNYLDDLTRSLRDNYDFLLLSMAGNDFVGTKDVNGQVVTSFGEFILDFDGQTTGQDVLNQHAVSLRLDSTIANYQRIFRLCEGHSANKNIQIVTHIYDYAMPTSRGANVLNRFHVGGPWMYTDLVNKRIPPSLWNDVARAFLSQFATRLKALAHDLNTHTQTGVRLHVADTQGTLPEGDSSYWINEIHPRNIGYELLVKKLQAIIDPIRDALPGATWRAWPA